MLFSTKQLCAAIFMAVFILTTTLNAVDVRTISDSTYQSLNTAENQTWAAHMTVGDGTNLRVADINMFGDNKIQMFSMVLEPREFSTYDLWVSRPMITIDLAGNVTFQFEDNVEGPITFGSTYTKIRPGQSLFVRCFTEGSDMGLAEAYTIFVNTPTENKAFYELAYSNPESPQHQTGANILEISNIDLPATISLYTKAVIEPATATDAQRSFTFVGSSVPEPGSALLAMMGGSVLFFRRRR